MRHKLRAVAKYDSLASRSVDFSPAHASFKARLEEAAFAGVVLDYDGTVITDAERESLPRQEILDELQRLLDGSALGIVVRLVASRDANPAGHILQRGGLTG
ncbi:MAG: hypothetical protein JZU55_16440, partial [Afipia sp.]|nr:hypothetical protein [Afipia sp.]